MLRACDNPFAVHRVLRLRYRLSESEWDQLLARLEALHHRAALVGPCGSGKTTMLEDLAERLESRGWRIHWVRLSSDRGQLPAEAEPSQFGPKDFILLDGAEQLSWWSWSQFRFRARRAGGLVITTHRPGRLSQLRHCTTNPALLQALIGDLAIEMSEKETARLYARHHGNLREALRELYDRWAGL